MLFQVARKHPSSGGATARNGRSRRSNRFAAHWCLDRQSRLFSAGSRLLSSFVSLLLEWEWWAKKAFECQQILCRGASAALVRHPNNAACVKFTWPMQLYMEPMRCIENSSQWIGSQGGNFRSIGCEILY
ncbi:uncharacterized protein BDV17DRAFT_276491 [Aspergillus undulatus]|uniref:uncharacterized protein n=1 Tax=Aspergillus undulatus TaxID=1810928 RepID=UPI003CCE3DE2